MEARNGRQATQEPGWDGENLKPFAWQPGGIYSMELPSLAT